MRIHFICMGNTYRSRLAEAYVKSLHYPNLIVSSSGVRASKDIKGPVSSYTLTVAKRHRLADQLKPHWDQLTQSNIDKADIVVFMNRSVYQAAGLHFKLPDTAIIWNIPDIQDVYRKHPERIANEQLVDELANRTFLHIKNRSDELLSILKILSRPSDMIDALKPDGTSLHKTISRTEANRTGVWHAGVHVGLYTDDAKVLVQQRASSIIENPNLWELSLGGAVDTGETPEQAALRETKEEVGITLDPAALQVIGVRRYNRHLTRYGLHVKSYLHLYVARIPAASHLALQKREVKNSLLVPIGVLGNPDELAAYGVKLVNYPALHRELLEAITAAQKV